MAAGRGVRGCALRDTVRVCVWPQDVVSGGVPCATLCVCVCMAAGRGVRGCALRDTVRVCVWPQDVVTVSVGMPCVSVCSSWELSLWLEGGWEPGYKEGLVALVVVGAFILAGGRTELSTWMCWSIHAGVLKFPHGYAEISNF